MKKNQSFNIILVLLVISLLSCSKVPILEGIDIKEWIADKNACSGKRLKMKDIITSQKDKLLGLNEMELIKLLGNPDSNELYTRNQKFYYYSILPSKDCKLATQNPKLELIIRFTAMGVANEVSIE